MKFDVLPIEKQISIGIITEKLLSQVERDLVYVYTHNNSNPNDKFNHELTAYMEQVAALYNLYLSKINDLDLTHKDNKQLIEIAENLHNYGLDILSRN